MKGTAKEYHGLQLGVPPLDNEPPGGYHHRRIRPSPFHFYVSAILTVPDSAPLLSVVIVNFNTRDWLQGCLESLEQQDVFERIQVVVVDNASTYGSAAMVRPVPRSRKEMHRESLHYLARRHYRGTRFCLTRMAFRLMHQLT